MNAKNWIVIAAVYACAFILLVVGTSIQLFPFWYAWRYSGTFLGFLARSVIGEMICFVVVFGTGGMIMHAWEWFKKPSPDPMAEVMNAIDGFTPIEDLRPTDSTASAAASRADPAASPGNE